MLGMITVFTIVVISAWKKTNADSESAETPAPEESTRPSVPETEPVVGES